MAIAMRHFFIKSLKRFLASGEMRSKYLFKFEVSLNHSNHLLTSCFCIDRRCYLPQELRDSAQEPFSVVTGLEPLKVHLQTVRHCLSWDLLSNEDSNCGPNQCDYWPMDQPGAENAAYNHRLRSVQRHQHLLSDDWIRWRFQQHLCASKNGQVWSPTRVDSSPAHTHGLPLYHLDVPCLFLRPLAELDPWHVRSDSSSGRHLDDIVQNHEFPPMAGPRQAAQASGLVWDRGVQELICGAEVSSGQAPWLVLLRRGTVRSDVEQER